MLLSSKKPPSIKAPLPEGADYKEFGMILWEQAGNSARFHSDLFITLQYSLYGDPPIVEVSHRLDPL